MIIIEGPDNSGKSTLVEWIKENFYVTEVNRRHGPPVDAQDILERTELVLDTEIHSHPRRNFITDRFSLIGESVYGPILRGKDLWKEIPQDKERVEKTLRILNPFVIYCRPDLDTILDLSHHRVKSYDTQEHLSNLAKNQGLIVKAYDNYFENNPFPHFYKYNYKRGEEALNELKNLLGEYLKW